MHPQVPPQNTPLLWQLNSHKHISSIPELLRCCTIIVVTLNLMYVQVFKLRRKSHSLLDDPRTYTQQKSSAQVGVRVNSVLTRNGCIKYFISLLKEIILQHLDAF